MKTTKTTLLTLAAGLALTLASAVHAADAPAAAAAAPMAPATATAPAKPKTAQQEKMATCNADAKTTELKGDARKSFMSECLKSKPAA